MKIVASNSLTVSNVNAITIDSAPPKGKAPYSIMTVKELPAIAE